MKGFILVLLRPINTKKIVPHSFFFLFTSDAPHNFFLLFNQQ